MSSRKCAPATRRNRLLAVVHIAKSELDMDDDIYRQIVCRQCKHSTGSAAQCNDIELVDIIKYFESLGWKNKAKKSRRQRKAGGAATKHQIKLARSIWARMAEDGIVRDASEPAFRRFVQSQTRRYHPQRVGYTSLEFAPGFVAQRIIEHLKSWAKRCDVDLDLERQ